MKNTKDIAAAKEMDADREDDAGSNDAFLHKG